MLLRKVSAENWSIRFALFSGLCLCVHTLQLILENYFAHSPLAGFARASVEPALGSIVAVTITHSRSKFCRCCDLSRPTVEASPLGSLVQSKHLPLPAKMWVALKFRRRLSCACGRLRWKTWWWPWPPLPPASSSVARAPRT